MRVTLVRSTVRTDTQVMRLNGDQWVVVLLPWDATASDALAAVWDATASDTLAALAPLLTEVERVELEAALTDGKERM